MITRIIVGQKYAFDRKVVTVTEVKKAIMGRGQLVCFKSAKFGSTSEEDASVVGHALGRRFRAKAVDLTKYLTLKTNA